MERPVEPPQSEELGRVLALLRVARGWSQEELAASSGVRSGSISDYERNRMIPSLKTLERLLEAMGYSLSAIEQTESFVRCLEAGTISTPPGPLEDSFVSPMRGESGETLRREIEQVAEQAGKFVHRLIRLLFLVLLKSRSRAA